MGAEGGRGTKIAPRTATDRGFSTLYTHPADVDDRSHSVHCTVPYTGVSLVLGPSHCCRLPLVDILYAGCDELAQARRCRTWMASGGCDNAHQPDTDVLVHLHNKQKQWHS